MTPVESWLFLAVAVPSGVAVLWAYCRAVGSALDAINARTAGIREIRARMR